MASIYAMVLDFSSEFQGFFQVALMMTPLVCDAQLRWKTSRRVQTWTTRTSVFFEVIAILGNPKAPWVSAS